MEEGTLKSPGFLGEFLGESGVGEMQVQEKGSTRAPSGMQYD